jgi:hypothetical protein
MRRFLITTAALGAIAWTSPAWALVDETKDVPATDEHGSIASGSLTIATTKGEVIATGRISNGVAHIEIRSKHVTKDTPVLITAHNDQTNETSKDKKTLGAFLDFGFAAGGAASSMYSQSFYNTHFSIYGGAADMLNWSTRSASGFYTAGGTTNGAGSAGTAFGGAFAWDFGRAWGLIFSAVAVYDQFDTALTWTGKCAGVTCNGAGRVVDNNFIGEFKATLPLPGNNSINGYVGAGVTIKSPVGAPTGPGGPEIWGKDRVTAFRVGCEIDHQFNPSWSGGFKIGYQHTDSSSYATSLPGERFLMGPQNTWLAVAVVTFTPQISGPTLFGNVM